MCRMIAAPWGLPGHLLIEPFVRMAQGRNTLNEINTSYGKWTHGEGWGAVYVKNGRLEVRRSILPCWEDPALESLRDERIFLLHARKASSGAVEIDNSHPFDHIVQGTKWFYCHNGTVKDPLPTPATLQRTVSTDSEKVFHMLLPHLADGQVFEGLRAVYLGIRDFTCLNSFLLGTDTFWAVSLFSENPNYYALSFNNAADGPVFSSEPLSEFAGMWTPIPNGHVARVDRSCSRVDLRVLGDSVKGFA